MKTLLSQLIMFTTIKDDSILNAIADVVSSNDQPAQKRAVLYTQVRKILEIATTYGFTENLWAGYITYLLMTDENPIALVSEKRYMPSGTAEMFFEDDLTSINKLLHYDFSSFEEDIQDHTMSKLQNYTAVKKNERMYYSFISKTLNTLRKQLMQEDIPLSDTMKQFYHDYGVGMFGLNKAFRIQEDIGNTPQLVPINNLEQVQYDDLQGYEYQKKLIQDNVRAFVNGKAANNMLLYGDAGTGKSTSVKATLNEFYPEGLRLIEIYKHQFKYLSYVISAVKSRNYKFIIFMDDLSFEEFEIEYKYLKAVIEGGFETKPDNIMIVATSNRRHLIKENLSDRKDMIDQEDIHHSDTIEEKLSLVDRFGLNILFSRPTYQEYHQIVLKLAQKYHIDMPEEELIRKANTWSVRKGGYTGRIAQQFINSLAPELTHQEEE